MLFEVVEVDGERLFGDLEDRLRTEYVRNALVLLLPLQGCPAEDVRNVWIVCIEFGHGGAPHRWSAVLDQPLRLRYQQDGGEVILGHASTMLRLG